MESTKTKELRSRKNSVRSKLMAAVAMLLVSTILLSSTTYAWFVLSTAPEVKGMSTTVGANGSLEIALLNSETGADTSRITTAVGDSSANTTDHTVQEANVTWGNLVSLGAGYGLDTVTLYPASLNTTDGTSLASLSGPLKTPRYGVDGRVAEVKDNTTSGIFDTAKSYFPVDDTAYGVRAVGTMTTSSPAESALFTAKASYNRAMRQAALAAKGALNADNSLVLANMLMNHAIESSAQASNLLVPVTITDISALRNILTGLQSSVDYTETALKWAVAAKLTSEDTITTDITGIDLSNFASNELVGSYIANLSTLKSSITTQLSNYNNITATGADGAYVWDDYDDVLSAILDTSTVKVAGKNFTEIKDLGSNAQSWALKLVSTGATMDVYGGLLSDTANFVDTVDSGTFAMRVSMKDDLSGEAGAPVDTTGSIKANKTTDVTTAYLTALQGALQILTVVGGSGQTEATLSTKYGYMVDLAFRCSKATTLQLSAAANRVNGDNETAGGGSTFTLTEGDINQLARALRIVFVDTDTLNILGVAGISIPENTEGLNGVYPLAMYNKTVDAATGGIALTTTAGTDAITELAANAIKKISVLVYLDGNYTDYAMDEIMGSLNLQFSSSETLTPMEYTGYVDAPNTNAQPGETQPSSETEPKTLFTPVFVRFIFPEGAAPPGG